MSANAKYMLPTRVIVEYFSSPSTVYPKNVGSRNVPNPITIIKFQSKMRIAAFDDRQHRCGLLAQNLDLLFPSSCVLSLVDVVFSSVRDNTLIIIIMLLGVFSGSHSQAFT